MKPLIAWTITPNTFFTNGRWVVNTLILAGATYIITGSGSILTTSSTSCSVDAEKPVDEVV